MKAFMGTEGNRVQQVIYEMRADEAEKRFVCLTREREDDWEKG